MHSIEPFFNWRHIYISEEDERSPFFGREYSEFEFTNTIYNYVIHPQWDDFGSSTLYIKIIFADYKDKSCVIEFIGEWNDALYNDIMLLKRDVIDHFIHHGINRFVLFGENVLNFHYSDESYYEEWFEDVDDGWIVLIGFREHVLSEMKRAHLDWYLHWGGELDDLNWRSFQPMQLVNKVGHIVHKRIG